MLVAFREVRMLLLLLMPPWVTGARLKFDIVTESSLSLAGEYRENKRRVGSCL
jgi:hypothetical protein